MAISGSETASRAGCGRLRVWRACFGFHQSLRLIVILPACVLLIALSATVSAQTTMTFGRPAATEALIRLKLGVSTKPDVRAALGEPRGGGFARHTPKQELREIWFYEYVQVRGEQVGLKFALVFFRNDRYDGHLWFATKQLVGLSLP